MSSIEISADKLNVNLENGTVILTGIEASEIVTEVGATELLNAMDYSDIMDYVVQTEKDKADEEFDRRSDR